MIRQILKPFLAPLGLALAFVAVAMAQPTSNGSDGAYLATISGDFDPNNLTATCPTCAAVVNAAGDNVFNFTTITVNTGVTIRMRASKVRNMPVVLLATGNVAINGTLNLSGDAGYQLNATDQSQIILTRRPAEPGAGGYYGGLGARGGQGPESGAGPGGGGPGQVSSTVSCYGGTGASFLAITPYTPYVSGGYPNPAGLGTAYGNSYLVPLYGGSGGGGGWGTNVNDVGGGGGAGGGAIRIFSATQISVAGSINAGGGTGGAVINDATYCFGGPGAGGSIHLIAPTITGAGSLNVQSGFQANGTVGALDGFVRFNVTNYTYTGPVLGGCSGAACATNTYTNTYVGPFYNVPANTTLTQPSLSITQVNGVNVPTPPQGQYLSPDVQINTNSAVNVNIAASNIPVGTVVTLRVTSETGSDQSIACPALAGTLASSTATCSATFPFSVSLSNLRATW